MVDYLKLTIPQALRLAAQRLRNISHFCGDDKYNELQYEADACDLAAEGIEKLYKKGQKLFPGV